MARPKKIQSVELTPKTSQATERLSYHGTRWIFTKELMTPYPGAPKTLHINVLSRDGKKCLWIQKNNDPDFNVRFL